MKLKTIIIAIILFVLPFGGIGQILQFEVPDFYTNRIKTLDQFMERFNRKDIPSFLDSTDSELPYKQIITCFNLDSVRLRGREVVEFAHHMVDSSIKLDYAAPNYYCELDCKAKFGKQTTSVKLRMIVEKNPLDYYSWVIESAEGEVLKLSPNRTSSKMKLSPVDNERYFLDLRDVLKDHPEDILNYSMESWSVDQTSVFMSLISQCLLRIESIENLRYVFNTAGYTFKVQCFDRETNNNGWLIYEFNKNEKKQID